MITMFNLLLKSLHPPQKNNDYTHEPKVTRNRYGEAYAAYAKLLLEMREEGDAAQL
jgi:hypothetical protein